MTEETMLRLFTSKGNSQVRKVKEWLNDQNIAYIERDISSVTKNDLIILLSKTGDGFQDILKRNGKYIEALGNIENLTFNELCSYILEDKNLLKCPIMVDEKKVFTGFHSDEIRKFIPNEIRRNRREIFESNIS